MRKRKKVLGKTIDDQTEHAIDTDVKWEPSGLISENDSDFGRSEE